MTDIRIGSGVAAALKGAEAVIVVAPKQALDAGWHRTALGADRGAALDPVVEDLSPGDTGAAAGTYATEGAPRRLIAAALPDDVSRHNTPTRAEAIRHAVSQAKTGDAKKVAVLVRLDDPSHLLAAAIAVARVHPLYDRKTGGKKGAKKRTVTVVGLGDDGRPVRPGKEVAPTVEAVRLAMRLVDTPPDDMRTADVEREAKKAVKGMGNVKVSSVVGRDLLRKRMGGIYGVGRAASVPPRLVVLEYAPKKKARRTVALVGKGIIYDTGGLSIKVGGGMVGMKGDMGGAAAVLGAFLSLVAAGVPDRVYCLLCLAENAVGPDSYRPDDILEMHSGKTVEINNTDAEGRLVLADGVSYAARDLKADLVIDAATLTGAALVATGKIVSCTVSNRAGLEQRSVASGRLTGDLTFPLLFVPEFYRGEFASKVADMRNSVKDRMNAQSSCAAQFVYNHIEDVNPAWLHLDIAGPAFRDDRGTGHGVALVAEIVRSVTKEELAG